MLLPIILPLMRRHVFTLILVLLPQSGVGCIALPMPGLLASERTDTNNNFVGKIGDQNSSAPLRVGVSARAEGFSPNESCVLSGSQAKS